MKRRQVVIVACLAAAVCLTLGFVGTVVFFNTVSPRQRQPAAAASASSPELPTATRLGTAVPGSGGTSVQAQASPEPGATPTQLSDPVGIVRVDQWVFRITEIRVDPSPKPYRESLVLLGHLTNEGAQPATFTAFGTLKLLDAQGRTYEDDQTLTWAAEETYGADVPASVRPDGTMYIAIAFDIPADARSLTIVRGSLTESWGGNIKLSLP